jgi:hypothetical protein
MSTIKTNSIEEATSGGATYFLSKAWVNFNSTGTASIRDDGNVSSITDNGGGDFTTNFSSSLTNANYGFYGCVGNSKQAAVKACNVFATSNEGATPYTMTSSAVRHITSWGGTSYDTGLTFVQVTN